MQRYSVQLLNQADPVEKQVLDAFRDNTRLHCYGEKFGITDEFDLSVYEVTGRKRNLAEHVLSFAGVDWISNMNYDATVADPTKPGSKIELTLGHKALSCDIKNKPF